jgi:acetylornithine deacetylase
MRALTDLTRDLVSTASHEDESRAGDLIETWLAEHTDADVTRDGAANVIARRTLGDAVPDAESRSLAFVGHHDVVPPDDSQLAGDSNEDADRTGEYAVEERDGRLYGRGTADMKGAVAAAMCAFRDAASNASKNDDDSNTSRSAEQTDADVDSTGGETPSVDELVFASFVGEEVGGVGARHAIDAGFAPGYAIVGEGSTNYSNPNTTDVAVAHKGRRASTITARGDAAHASEPEAGENAVYRACDAVDVVRGIEAPAVEIAGEELRGSVVVTEIEGGSAWNVIPDSCTLTIDERTVPGERAPLGDVGETAGVSWDVDQDLPPMRCESDAFAETVRGAAAAAQETPPELVTKPHATDAGWLAEAGTACVVCGPAEPGEAHTETESVSIEVLNRCCRIYRGAAEAMC